MPRLFVLAILAVPVAAGFASGCASFGFLDADLAGGAGGDTGQGGAGGGHKISISTAASSSSGTSSGEGTGGGYGGSGGISYTYLCGGSQPDCTPDPGSSDCAPGGTGNMGGAAPDAGAKLTCHLVPSGSTAAAVCGISGETGEGGVCHQATDCQAGLGCAATDVPNLGVCRAYCCGATEACGQDTYCAPTTMAEGGAQVPLCQPVTMCELLNDAAWCQPGQVCAIVRADGTTSCVEPGDGLEGGSCPCAPGYTCWNANNQCLKLCHVEGGNECGTGTCQGGDATYPTGIGVCVPQSAQ